MLTANQTAALKRVTKKLSAMRKTLPKTEREMLDYLIVGATTEVKGHSASVLGRASDHGRASDRNRLTALSAKKISKRSVGARVEVEGHVMYDTRIGAKKEQGMLKDPGAMREGGAMKDSAAAAEVTGHAATVAGAATTAGAASIAGAAKDSAAASVRDAVAFNAAMNAYVVADK